VARLPDPIAVDEVVADRHVDHDVGLELGRCGRAGSGPRCGGSSRASPPCGPRPAADRPAHRGELVLELLGQRLVVVQPVAEGHRVAQHDETHRALGDGAGRPAAQAEVVAADLPVEDLQVSIGLEHVADERVAVHAVEAGVGERRLAAVLVAGRQRRAARTPAAGRGLAFPSRSRRASERLLASDTTPSAASSARPPVSTASITFVPTRAMRRLYQLLAAASRRSRRAAPRPARNAGSRAADIAGVPPVARSALRAAATPKEESR
jgi:hypothetical protein